MSEETAATWQPSDEISIELDDAFQFSHRHSYVTREWVESLLAREYERGHRDGWTIGQEHARICNAAPESE